MRQADKNSAKALCAQMGIQWDDEASVPSLNGAPLSEEHLRALFAAPDHPAESGTTS